MNCFEVDMDEVEVEDEVMVSGKILRYTVGLLLGILQCILTDENIIKISTSSSMKNVWFLTIPSMFVSQFVIGLNTYTHKSIWWWTTSNGALVKQA